MSQLFISNSLSDLDEMENMKRENALLRKLLMKNMRGLLDQDERSLDNPYLVAARCMMIETESKLNSETAMLKKLTADLEETRAKVDANYDASKAASVKAEAVLKEAKKTSDKLDKIKKKADQRDRAYKDIAALEKRLKVVTALSDKYARDNKQFATKCAKLERDLEKACKDRASSPSGDKGRKVADLERDIATLVARAELAERALAESRLELDALVARAEEAELRLSAAAAEAEARARKEVATDRETLVANISEWEAAVKQYRDKIGTAKIALSREQTDKFSEYRAKCAFLRIKMDELCGGNPVKDYVLHETRLEASDKRALIGIHEALCSALHQVVPNLIGLRDAEKLMYALLA